MLFSTTSSSLPGNKFHKKPELCLKDVPRLPNRLSLNDILQLRPTIQKDLYSIVRRFRTHQV